MSHATWFVILIFIIVQTVEGIYFGLFPFSSGLFALVSNYIIYLGINNWLKEDRVNNPGHYRILNNIFELGFLIYIAWPVILPYYLIKTRGWGATAIIFAFIFLYFASFICGMFFADLIRIRFLFPSL